MTSGRVDERAQIRGGEPAKKHSRPGQQPREELRLKPLATATIQSADVLHVRSEEANPPCLT
jgi:hypothetical protein